MWHHSGRNAFLIERLDRREYLSAPPLPRPDHVVVVVEEDHSYDQILGASTVAPPADPALWTWIPPQLTQAPYIQQLASLGASFTNAHSVGHKNQTDYQALLSGLPAQANPDKPLTDPNAPNLASELIAANMTFGGYSESLPATGYSGGDVGLYTQVHNPWVELHNIPATDNLPFSQFPKDYAKLPTVSFVVPNNAGNMHGGLISTADDWLNHNLSGYADWALKHNSLLIVTWDESHTKSNSIPTLFFGPMVESGKIATSITQLNILRTLEDMYGLTPTGNAANVAPITQAFMPSGVTDTSEDHTRRSVAGRGSISGLVEVSRSEPGSPSHYVRAAGWEVYLDLNNDGYIGGDEPVAVTDRHGRFHFHGLANGVYVVRIVQNDGFNLTSPLAGYVTASVGGNRIGGVVFSEQQIT
jgi:acid phosphatase